MKCTYLFVFLLGIFLPWVSARHVQFYRKDYTYVEEFDAFYKVHWDLYGASWDTAFLACDDEGASLFYPKAKGEWALVKNLTQNMSKVPNVTDIFVGIHDEFGLGEFFTVDGHSAPYPLIGAELHVAETDNCITMDIETGLFKIGSCHRTPDSPLPFVCKKTDDESCPTVDRNYKYSPVSKKCYKVNDKLKTWEQAVHTCFVEGGMLTVIENRAVADVIRDMSHSQSKYFMGVRKIFPHSKYYSLKGQKFSEIYQSNYDNERYDCGAVYFESNSVYTSTEPCDNTLPFICEMEVNSGK